MSDIEYDDLSDDARAEVDEILRELKTNPISSALPKSRAERFFGRLVGILREHGSELTVEEVLEARSLELDQAAMRKEHEQ